MNKEKLNYIYQVSNAAAHVAKRCNEYTKAFENAKNEHDSDYMCGISCQPQNAALKRAIREFKYVAGDCEKAL